MSQDIRQILANNIGKINITLDKIEMLANYFETEVYLLLK